MTVHAFLQHLGAAAMAVRETFRPRHSEAICLGLLRDIEAAGGEISDGDARTESELFLSALAHGLVDGSAWGAAFHVTPKGRRLLAARR